VVWRKNNTIIIEVRAPVVEGERHFRAVDCLASLEHKNIHFVSVKIRGVSVAHGIIDSQHFLVARNNLQKIQRKNMQNGLTRQHAKISLQRVFADNVAHLQYFDLFRVELALVPLNVSESGVLLAVLKQLLQLLKVFFGNFRRDAQILQNLNRDFDLARQNFGAGLQYRPPAVVNSFLHDFLSNQSALAAQNLFERNRVQLLGLVVDDPENFAQLLIRVFLLILGYVFHELLVQLSQLVLKRLSLGEKSLV
jgi:hypothetical protein